MQSDDKAYKLKCKPTTKTTATTAQYDPEKQTTTTTATTATSSTESTKQRTIGALVRGIHDTGAHDLHRPLLSIEEEQHSSTKSTKLAARRGMATEIAPHASLPRLVINIESSSEALTTTTLDGSTSVTTSRAVNALSPSPTPTRSLTPDSYGQDGLNGEACSGSVNGDNHLDQSTTPNTTRRFSHFNLALRRFSHIHVHVLLFLFSPSPLVLFISVLMSICLSLSNLSLVVCVLGFASNPCPS